MSQLLSSAIINRTASATVNTTKSLLIPNPGVPLKTTQFISQQYSLRNYSLSSCHSKIYKERIHKNAARLYARRIIELASFNAATMSSMAMMESSGAVIEKPKEWKTVDLVEQRRQFGENISSLGKSKISRVWAAGSRIASLTLLASPLAILAPVAYITPKDSTLNNMAWNYSVWAVEKAGPTFIKLVQWATTRNDIFPTDFIHHFSKLQDSTRGHSWKETEILLKDSYGEEYKEWFEFDASQKNNKIQPIGSGCIAQVYKATLKKDTKLLPSGSEVAIKVTHPNILHKVCVDFYIMNKITQVLESIPYIHLDYLSMRDSVQQFRDIMLPQLDLRVEARNLQRFRRDFGDEPRIEFPQPIADLTTDKVLVESFIHGEPILNYCDEGRKPTKDREVLAELGLETVMKMIFLYDFVHGDLHPGNIIINKNKNARGNPLCMNMIDCGLVVEMGEIDHVTLVKILGAFIKRDGNLAGQLMVDTAKKCNANKLDVELFCKGMEDIVKADQEQNFLESVGDYLADICYLACKHKVKLEASIINVALACEIMEGIASKLYPTMKVQHIALPMVFKAEVMHGLSSMKKKSFF